MVENIGLDFFIGHPLLNSREAINLDGHTGRAGQRQRRRRLRPHLTQRMEPVQADLLVLAAESVEMLQAAVTVAERVEMVLAGRNGSFQPEQPQRWSWSAAV